MARRTEFPDPKMPSAKSVARAYLAVLVGVALLALAVRVHHLGVEDFWQDEIHSMYNSAGARGPAERIPHGVILRDLPRYSDLTSQSTLAGVWRTMDDDSHPPVYFMLLLLWRKCVGDGEAWIRLMPVVFSVLSILPVMGLLREVGDRRAAIIAGLMLALGFCHINMAQENRPYSLSGLLVSLSFYLLVRIEHRWGGWSSRWRWIHATLYGTVLFAAMMNHYFAAFAFVGQLVYVLIRWRGPLLRTWFAATVLAATVFCLVWGPHLWSQRDFIASQEWLIEKAPDHAQRTVLRVADLPIRFLVRVNRYVLNNWTALAGAAVLGAVACGLRRHRAKGTLLFACWYVVPVLILATIDLTTSRQQLTHFRYMSVVIPGLCGLIALVLTAAPRVVRTGGLAVFLMLSLLTLLTLPAQDNPHSRRAVKVTQAGRGPSDLLILDTIGWPSYCAPRLYQMLSFYLPSSGQPILLLSEPPDDALAEQIAGFDQLYFVSPRQDRPELSPLSHPFVEYSDYFKEIGIVYRCSRRAPIGE